MTTLDATPGTAGALGREEHDLATVRVSPALVGAWNDLARRSAPASYFRSADWACSWWETVGEQAPTRVAMWRDAPGAVHAVAALSTVRETLDRRLPLRFAVDRVTGTGRGDADHCGPVVAAGRPALAAEVTAWLVARSGRRPLLVTGAAPSAAREFERVPCPRLDLDGPVERVGRSANFRSQLARYERRLERAGVTFGWHPPGTVRADLVDTLLELHHGLRGGRGQSTSLDAGTRALLHGCAARGSATLGPAAVVAAKGDDVVAVLLGFWCAGWFGAYQSGWDATYAPHSIGSVLVANAIRHVAAAGGHTFDFLRGDEAYKYRFGATDQFDCTSLVPRGLGGRLLQARAALRARRAGSTGD